MRALRTADYVQMLKDKYDLKSNYAVAKFLNVDQKTVPAWTKGKATFNDRTALIIAEKLEIEASIIITSCHLERALKNQDFATAGVYRRMLEQLAPLAVKGLTAAATYTALLSMTGCFGGF